MAYGSGGATDRIDFGIICATSAYSELIFALGAVTECIGFRSVFPCNQSVCLSGNVAVNIGPVNRIRKRKKNNVQHQELNNNEQIAKLFIEKMSKILGKKL